MSDRKFNRWNDPQNGIWQVNMIQCKKCIHNNKNPLRCIQYPNRKLSSILKCEEECKYFERIKV